MIVEPRGAVYIYKNVKIGDNIQICWGSSSERDQYFADRAIAVLSDEDYSYIQHSGNRIKIELNNPDTFGTLQSCNYVSFRNTGFGETTFFARLVDWERINNHVAAVSFYVDWFQTYYFSPEFKILTSQVDREGLSLDDDQALQSNNWADNEQMLTSEPLASGPHLERNYNTIEMRGSFTAEELASEGFGPSSSIKYKFKNWRAVLIAYQDENGYGFNDVQPSELSETGNSYTNTTAVQGVYQTENTEGMPFNRTIADIPLVSTGRYCEGVYISNDFWEKKGITIDRTRPCNMMTYSSFPQPLYICIFDIKNNNLFTSQWPGEGQTTETRRLNTVLQKYARNGITSSIIGLYFLPECVYAPAANEEGSPLSNYGEFFEIPTDPDSNLVPKLNRTPFKYLRVTDYNGNSQDYALERFRDIDSGKVRFGVVGSIVGEPTVSICPVNYKYKSTGGQTTDRFSIEQRFVISSFPQIPFVVDGYLTYLAGQVQAVMEMNANPLASQQLKANAMRTQAEYYRNSIEQRASIVSGVANTFGGAAELVGGTMGGNPAAAGGGFGSVINAVPNMLTAGVTTEANKQMIRADNARIANIQRMVTAETNRRAGRPETPEVYAEAFGGPEVYLLDEFHRPAGDVVPYMLDNYFVRVDLVELRSSILTEYNTFFKMYGYNTGRTKVPYIYNYIKNPNGVDVPRWYNIPNFVIDGNDSYNNVTYCRCTNITIVGLPDEAARWIENMFLRGMRFCRRSS